MPRPHGTQAVSWWDSTTPPTNVALAAASWVGVGFQLGRTGRIAGMRQWVESGVSSVRWGLIWNSTTGKLLTVAAFRSDVALPVNAWYQTWFRPWVRINTSDNYRIAVLMYTGYHRTGAALVVPVTHNGVQFISSFQTTALDPVAAAITTNTNANGVDILFQQD